MQNKDNVLAEIVKKLVDAYKPERIYLFGSHARGETGPDSDYDLMVVVRQSDLPLYRRAQQAFRVLRGMDASKGVIVLTEEEFTCKQAVVTSLPATVKREGKLLYTA
ncbi:MAG: nucleotidyltransferase domain-containing protein [bacterium]|nr:nucleotidyltransferase domain-containing protein [bacterium]